MEHDKTISCHSCEEIITIKDEFGEIDIEDILFCPFCGEKNIDVEE